MKELGDTLGVPMHVFGPETHMTAIVGMALGTRSVNRKGLDDCLLAKCLVNQNL